MKAVVLCVVAGMGAREERDGNALSQASTPVLDGLRASYPHATLAASGDAVGLREGDVGNSEAGYLTIGAGRRVRSSRHRIDEAIARRKLALTPAVDRAVRVCTMEGCKLHLIGLLSDAGVHSAFSHLEALIDAAVFHDIPVRIHAILDGRDVPLRSASRYLGGLELLMERGDVKLATVSGRGYSMACDGRWDLTYQAFHAMVRDKVLGPAAPRADSWFDALQQAYANGLGDDWVLPTRIGDYEGLAGDFVCDFSSKAPVWEWTGKETAIAFNLRGDRMRQLSAMLSRRGLPEEVERDLLFDRQKPVRAFEDEAYVTLVDHGLGLPAVFAHEPVEETLGHVLGRAGARHLRIGETEGEQSFTEALSGRRIEPFDGEERAVLRSPRLVDRFSEKPAMSTAKVARRAVEAIGAGDHAFIVVDFVAPDAVAHCGDASAAIAAVEAVDAAIGEIASACRSAGATLLVTSTHGNVEELVSETGKPHPGHTAARVPLLYVAADAELREGGGLEDVAPTILELLGLEVPPAMTGRSLRVPKRT